LQKTLVFSSLVRDTVNRTGEYRLDTAGKGLNVCRVLCQLGKNVVHITQLGGALRPLYLELCAADSLNVQWVESYSNIRLCYTLIENAQTPSAPRRITELVEESEEVGADTEKELLRKFSSLLEKCSSLIISGTKARGFSDVLIPEMVNRAGAEKRTVILDLKGDDLIKSLPFKPQIIKPNLDEFLSTFAPELPCENTAAVKERVKKICEGLYDEYRCEIVLTRGKEPVWYTENGKMFEYVFESVPPLNSTGSGDAFTAGLAAAFGDGACLPEAVAEGARCGALNAALLKPGVIR